MDTLIQFTQSADSKVVLVVLALVVIWMFAKAIRWILNIALIAVVVLFLIWKIPAVQSFVTRFLG